MEYPRSSSETCIFRVDFGVWSLGFRLSEVKANLFRHPFSLNDRSGSRTTLDVYMQKMVFCWSGFSEEVTVEQVSTADDKQRFAETEHYGYQRKICDKV